MAALTGPVGRTAAGIAVVAATVAVVGAGPFLRGLASVSAPAIAVAVVLVGVATAASAWRWRVVAARLGLALPWRSAVGGYYRSQFINTVLPGGILGDVHRAYAHGRDEGEVGAAARAVAAERVAGQVVQTVLTVAILVPLGFVSATASAALAPVALTAGILLGVLAAAALVAAMMPRARRAVGRQLGMLRPLLARPSALVAVVAASVLVVAAHVGMFLAAGIAVGVSASPRELVPVALVALSASALPVNVGGWGPREAASAGVFAAAGLGGAAGVAVSTAFGVLAMLALVPGAVVLFTERRRARRTDAARRPIGPTAASTAAARQAAARQAAPGQAAAGPTAAGRPA